MLSESLRVPFRADDWIGTILVGWVLTLLVWVVGVFWVILLILSAPIGGLLLPLFALPSLVLRGYLLTVVRAGIRGEPTVDSFVRWGSLVRDGTRSTVISAIYLLPAAVFCGLALGGGVATAVDPEGLEGAIQAITALVILFGGFGLLIYGLVYLYVRPAARAVFASTGSVRDALDVRRVVRLSSTADYITGWLIAMGILVVGPTLLVPLLLVSLASAVVSPPLAFVGVLSTILLGFVLLFLCRLSAAYATGRASTTGLIDLSVSIEDPSLDGRPTGQTFEPPENFNPAEAPVAVQTGRTVRPDSSTAVVSSDATVTDDDSTQTANDETDTPAPDADSENEYTTDKFIWGPDDTE